ncbi:hypothetical protein MACK_001514 [Theileria orientalis]|uniref:ATP-dependent RNA helicase n=1 Tax=Theileria orientalis TaxID=68886 RepID=A0A976MD66_THEOR|nr:hypothetical protein MACK_001514 [Theileria orientalis]
MGSESQTAESVAESNNDSIESAASINASKWSIEPIDSRTFKLFSKSKRKLTSHKSCNNDSAKSSSAYDTIETSTNKTDKHHLDNLKNENIDENLVKRRKECSFESLGVPNWLIEISDSLQIKKPTRIQQLCLPSAFAGKNLIGCSETGSGKTICFCWPILVAFAKNPYGVFSLILTPTRELALQISDQFRVFGANLNVNIMSCVGGFDIIKQSTEMERRPHVVVATPGRLAYQVSIPERNLAKIFANVKYLVLDECDRLLDKNFEENLGVIMKCVPSSSEGRITFMFSATITPSIQYLTTSLSTKKEVSGSSYKDESNANEDGDSESETKYSNFELFDATENNCQRLQNNIQHEYIFLPQHVHMTYLVHVLNKIYNIDTTADSSFSNGANGKANHKKNNTNNKGRKEINVINGSSNVDKKGIIFVSTKKRCDLVYLTLEQLKFKVTCINSNMKQIKRNDNLSKFRSGHSNILVATDLVSRGIDVPEVEFIINLDFPSTVFDYIHRIGRTGRAGRSGIAISFIDEYDRDKVKNVESSTNIKLEKYQINDKEAVKLLNKVTVATQRAYLFLQQNENFRNKGLILKDIFKYRRNPEKNGEIEKLKVVEESNKKKFDSSNIELENKESQLKDKLSRVELVFGSSGLKLLNRSNVLVLGANELSSKIITHLIRSGVSSVTLWDGDKNLAEDKLEEIRILNPDCNIKSIHTDPEEYIKGGNYSTIIFANRPITEAIEYNNIFHGKCNFVYAFVSGTYGLVINDFGNHEIRVKSDYSHQDNICKLVYSGKKSCLEVTGSDLYNYKRNDVIQVRYTQENSKSKVRNKNKSGLNDHSVVIDTFKIVDVDRTGTNFARIWIETRSKRLPKNIVSVKKVDEVIKLNFGKIEDLLSRLLETKKLKALIRSIYDRVLKNGVIDKLVISPGCSNNLNNSSLSVLASLMALNRAKLYNLKEDLDSRNFYDLTKQVYLMSDYETVCNFNELKDLKIPAMITLIGGLAAQEAMKGITKMFTPTDMILVDRSDIFTLKNNGSAELKKDNKTDNRNWKLKENAKKSIDDVNKSSFLLIGAGALGCEYLRLLAEMKVSRVAVVDNDIVETSNLSRQSLFTQNDIGNSKAESSVNNLKLLYSTSQYLGYNMLFTEGVYGYFKSELGRSSTRRNMLNSDKIIGQRDEMDKWIGISAVDNIEGRLALDGFCTQNRMPLVESGIYGMQCSTSLTVPYVTESFSSSVSGESFKGKYSCSVKGVPENIDDCIFYSIELFSWLFNGQNVMLRNFLKNPIQSVELALERGASYFYTLLEIVNDYLLIIKEPMNNRHAKHMGALENVEIRKWALKMYEKYVGHETVHKNVLIETLSNLKLKSLKQFYPYSGDNVNKLDYRSFDSNKLKSLISQGFSIFEGTTNTANTSNVNNTNLDKNAFFSELDKYMSVVKNSTSSTHEDNGDDGVSAVNNVGPDELTVNIMVLEESCEDSMNFIYQMSNVRASKFKIPESDRVTIVKKAKNIVPAVSTCVSTSASLSLLELYKLAMLSRLNLHKNSCDDNVSIGITNNNHNCTSGNGDDSGGTEVVLNSKVTLRYLVDGDEVDFYNKGKLIFKIYPYDYSKNENATKYLNNYFFNTATLKFVSNIANTPKVYTINNKKSMLNNLSLSYWDYIYVDDFTNKVDGNVSIHDEYDDNGNVTSTSNNTSNSRSKRAKHNFIGRIVQNKILSSIFRKENELLRKMFDNEVKCNHNFIYLYELVDLIEYVFDANVDAITFQNGYVILNSMNRDKLLKDVLSERLNTKTPTPGSRTSGSNGTSKLPPDKQSRELILHIIARDKGTNESLELPDIQYKF